MISPIEISDSCGCCPANTPANPPNDEGLSAIRYRLGTHSVFKAGMLAALTAVAANSPLRSLKTREDDDPTIALIDAWAVVLDILSFYQERIANEGFLRTAVERFSILELARAVGYVPSPGVAAATHVAILLENAASVPTTITVSNGTQIQSIPGPGEKPQVFETMNDLEARRSWNEMTIRMSKPVTLDPDADVLYFQGTALNLQVGDPLLFVADAGNWKLRWILNVTVDHVNDRTRVQLQAGSIGNSTPTAFDGSSASIYVMRQKASIFGYNAPSWNSLSFQTKWSYMGSDNYEAVSHQADWPKFEAFSHDNGSVVPGSIDLDRVYPKITTQSWAILSDTGRAELYCITAVREAGRDEFLLSGKVSRLTLNPADLSAFQSGVRTISIYLQPEELTPAEFPVYWTQENPEIAKPVMGLTLDVDHFLPGIAKKRKIIVAGKRLRARLKSGKGLEITAASGSKFSLAVGESCRLMKPPAVAEDTTKTVYRIQIDTGRAGVVSAGSDAFIFAPAFESDEIVAEVAELDPATDSAAIGGHPATLTLKESLRGIYDRSTVKVYGNVVLATAGQSRQAILGSGNAAQNFQTYSLPDSPLTHVPSSAPNGSVSTLSLRVNDILWRQVATLHGAGPGDRVYVVSETESGKASVQFGDGKTGSRLPTGIENIRAEYRTGIGLAGNVGPERISLLMKPPLGVKSVVGPLPATGGADPEPHDLMRLNAPLSVLALDRIVSLADFESFARAFAGIGKARAEWLAVRGRRLVLVTVASQDGSCLGADSITLDNLKQAILKASDGRQPFILAEYRQLPFALQANIRLNPRYLKDAVFSTAADAVGERYSFAQRQFGQIVSKSDVIACLQSVKGVNSVDLDALYFTSDSPALLPILSAANASWTEAGIQPAALITVDPLQIGVAEVKP